MHMDFHMFSPLLATLGIDLILMTVIMAAASAAQAAAAQAAARKAADAQNAQMKDAQAKSMAVNKAQGDISAAEKRRAIQNRYDAYKGATKASSAERGLDSGSRTTTALMNALGIGAARESSKVSMEAALNSQAFGISSTPLWQTSQSSGLMTGLSGLQGGLQGLSMGMSMNAASASEAAAQAQLGAIKPP